MKKIVLGMFILLQGVSFAQSTQTQAKSAMDKIAFEAELDNSITKDSKAEIDGTSHVLTPEVSYKLNDTTQAILNVELELNNPEEGESESSFNAMELGFSRKLESPIANSKLKAGVFGNYLMESESREKNGYDGSIYLEMELKQKINNTLTLKVKPKLYQFLKNNDEDGIKNRALKLELNPIMAINEKISLELPIKFSKTYKIGDLSVNPSKAQFVPTLVFSLDNHFEIEFYDKMTMMKSGDEQFFANDIMKKAIYGANLIYSL
jgi:hypothetical protein